jgi:hypothetical protein
MLLAPITLFGNSAILTTDAVASTSDSTPIVYPGAAGLNVGTVGQPVQIRLLNIGTAMIWLRFSGLAAAAAVIPTPGVGATIGTPQPVSWLAPGIEITITIPCSIGQLAGVANTPIGFWLNHISAGVSQAFQLQVGDGT